MEKIVTVGLDLAKSVFQVHAVADDGGVVVRRAFRRSQVRNPVQRGHRFQRKADRQSGDCGQQVTAA